MAEEKLPHKIQLFDRKQLSVSGVTDVVSFDENAVILRTALGTLLVQGQSLQLKTLSPEGGQVDVAGTICALSYEEPRSGGWRRLLR